MTQQCTLSDKHLKPAITEASLIATTLHGLSVAATSPVLQPNEAALLQEEVRQWVDLALVRLPQLRTLITSDVPRQDPRPLDADGRPIAPVVGPDGVVQPPRVAPIVNETYAAYRARNGEVVKGPGDVELRQTAVFDGTNWNNGFGEGGGAPFNQDPAQPAVPGANTPVDGADIPVGDTQPDDVAVRRGRGEPSAA